MDLDLTTLDEEGATRLLLRLLHQLNEAREAVEQSERRAAGIAKMIDGLVEMFPATEDLLPEDLDGVDDPRPRGAEAIRRVLAQNPANWYTVAGIVSLLSKEGWLPKSSNPANAVRTALERLVESHTIDKNRSQEGAVIYGLIPDPPAYDEEPF